MKIELELKDREKLEVVANQKKQIEHELIGFLVPHNGHKIWEIEVATGNIKEAQYSSNTYKAFGENKKEIIVKDGCLYVSALNKKNAFKKAMEGKPSGKKINENPLALFKF